MLRWLFILCVVLPTLALAQTKPATHPALPPLTFPGWANDLDKARLAEFHGRYSQALEFLDRVKDGNAAERALIRADALAATGHSDEALATLQAAEIAGEAAVQVKRAEVLASLGNVDEASQLLQSHLKQFPQSIAGHYQLGRAAELRGDLEEARKAYGWFNEPGQDFLKRWQTKKEKGFDHADEVTLIARSLDRAAVLNGGYATKPELNDAIFEMFVRAYDVIDRTYWPAHVAAAEYYLSHDDADAAGKELQAAFAGNPNDATATNLVGQISVSKWDFDAADAQVAALRSVDPQSFSADLLATRNLLQQRDPKDAETLIKAAVKKQPKNLEALGLLAACEGLQLHIDAMNAALKQVEKIDPDNASAYFEAAAQLGAMRQYPRAATLYKTAIDRAPWWTGVRNQLGLLYTQSGDEDSARETLKAAHDVDPYNLSTTNYLRLLDDLAKFTRKESAHFIVAYDAKADPLIPEYFGEYCESIYADVTKSYAQEPLVKTFIEVFPTHDAFSVRTTGSPWIGTVGASTGRVIAMVAPRKGEMTMGAFNWSQVLRHEFTHTVTLAATDNRIPHWMTEGLAVYEEHSPLKWEWVPMLFSAVSEHKLFTMDNLTWGFIRPKGPNDRSLAYAESFWVVTYIEQRFGHDAILKMLAAFKNGSDEETAFSSVLGMSRSSFQRDFFAWAQKEIEGWGYDPATSQKYDELREQGETLIKARDFEKALSVWQQIAAIRPVDPLPHQRLAGLYLRPEVQDADKAIEQLKILDAVELKDNGFAKRIARLYRDEKNFPAALHYATEAVYIDPYDPAAHDLLLQIGQSMNEPSVIDREQRVIPVLARWIKANTPPRP